MVKGSVHTRITSTVRSREAPVVVTMFLLAASSSLFAVLTSRWLGPADRGIVVVSATTGSLLMLLGSLGVGTAGRVLLSRSPALPLGQYLVISSRLAGFHLLTASLFGLGILWATHSLDDPVTAWLFVPYAILMLVAYLVREALHGLGLHARAVGGEVISTSSQTLLLLGLAPFLEVDLRMALSLMVFGQALQVAWNGALLVRRRRDESVAHDGAPALAPRRSVVHFGLRALPVILGQAFVTRGDRLVLGLLGSTSLVGLYGAAATLADLLWLMANAVGQVAFRRSTRTGRSSSSRVQRRLTLLFTTAGSIVMCLLAPWLVPWLLGEAFRPAVSLVYVLAIAAVPMASYQMDVSILSGLGRMRQAAKATATGSAVLALGCVALVPSLGGMGAALSSLAAYLTLAVLTRHSLAHTPSQETE